MKLTLKQIEALALTARDEARKLSSERAPAPVFIVSPLDEYDDEGIGHVRVRRSTIGGLAHVNVAIIDNRGRRLVPEEDSEAPR